MRMSMKSTSSNAEMAEVDPVSWTSVHGISIPVRWYINYGSLTVFHASVGGAGSPN